MTTIAATGGFQKTQKRAVVSLTGSGTFVAAVSGRRIKVYAFTIQSRSATMTVQLTDGNGGANLTRIYTLGVGTEKDAAPCTPNTYHFATTAGSALYVVITGTGTIDLDCSYWDDDAA